PKPSPQADGSPAATAPPKEQAAQGPKSTEDLVRERSSPLVRKIAKEHNVDISQIRGSGIAGRVTKDDILSFIAGQEGEKAERQDRRERKVEEQEGKAPRPEGRAPAIPVPPPPRFTPGAGDVVEKMSPMRKRIAEHMILSRRTSAHVHSVFEVNFSRLAQ